jgi:hypothetical protein
MMLVHAIFSKRLKDLSNKAVRVFSVIRGLLSALVIGMSIRGEGNITTSFVGKILRI